MFNTNNININNYEGFVYLITIKKSGLKYIGRKSFWSRLTLPPLKGKNRKRKVIKESNWKIYQSSHHLIKKLPKEELEFKILKYCEDKINLTYWENYYLYKHQAIIDEKYLNNNISGKFYRGKIK